MTQFNNKFKLFIALLSILFCAGTGYAQLSDLHYLPPLKQGGNNQAITQQTIYLSTPVTSAFTVNVYRGTSTAALATFSLSKATPVTYNLANGDNHITLVTNANTGTVLTNSGLRFEAPSGERFYVNYRGRSGSQAASITSKGRAAMGQNFKWGGAPIEANHPSMSATLGIMATEDGTTVNISGYDQNCEFRLGNDPSGITANSISITLDRGESYVLEAAKSATNANIDGWIGASITSNRDIVISNGMLNFGVSSSSANRDAGADQPVPQDKLGKDYVFVRGNGGNASEYVVIIGTEANTNVYVNGSGTAFANIGVGDHVIIPGTNYSGTSVGDNMLVTTSKNVYAYQVISGSSSTYSVSLNFVAPLNCLLPDTMDYIHNIQDISGINATGGLFIIASTSTPNANIVVTDGTGTVTKPAPQTVSGSADWKTFYLSGLTGDVSVQSTGPIAVGFLGFNGARGIAGYFSGFDTVPTVDLQVAGGGCLPGATIEVLDPNFDSYQWFDDGVLIVGATNSTYSPTTSGDYYVRVTKGGCTYDSQPISAYYCNSDIVVNKTANKLEVTEGDTISFEITVESRGVNPVTNLTISDVLPSGLTLVSANTSTGSWSAPNWSVGTLTSGQTETITIVATVDPYSGNQPWLGLTNTATNSQDQTDSNTTIDSPSTSFFILKDSDGDGVPDKTDLDDDNDGILDCVESSDSVNSNFWWTLNNPGGNLDMDAVDDPKITDWAISSATDMIINGIAYDVSSTNVEITSMNSNSFAEAKSNGDYIEVGFTTGDISNFELETIRSGWYRPSEGDSYYSTTQYSIGSSGTWETLSDNVFHTDDGSSYAMFQHKDNTPIFLRPNTEYKFRFYVYGQIDDSSQNYSTFDDVRFGISACRAVDSDNDGIPDHLDLDSDGDGIPDNVEAQTTIGYTAPNNDSPPTYLANNGVNSAYLGGLTPVNTDGTDNPDYLDLDSDNDGINDTDEANITLANNDADGDGLDDATDATPTTGYADPGGTIDDPLSGAVILPDIDNDARTGGDVDFRDDTDDRLDSDGDGILDFIDLDDDNDGIPDAIENAECFGEGESGNVFREDFGAGDRTSTPYTNYTYEPHDFPSGGGSVNDGEYAILNDIQASASWAPTVWVDKPDHTGDPNGRMALFNSTDSELEEFYNRNDITVTPNTYLELSFWVLNLDLASSSNSRSLPNITAYIKDNTGHTTLAILSTGNVTKDEEWHNYRFIFNPGANSQIRLVMVNNAIGGAGNDLALDDIEINILCDTDGDGIINSLDLDSDNDGILDVVEAGHNLPHTNGVLNGSPTDFGNNGLLNSLETNDTPDADINYVIAESSDDADTIPNFLDLDSDGDGIPDNVEAQTTIGYIPPNSDSPATYLANNGVNSAYLSGLTPVDTDGDGLLDYLDTDADNDGANDTIEAGITLANNDADNDGLDDATDETPTTGYADPGGTIDDPLTGPVILPDFDNDATTGGDVDFRDTAAPFTCDSSLYLSQYPNSGPASLFELVTTTNPLTVDPIGDDSHGVRYNAIGINPLDGFMYGIVQATNNLIRIGSDGSVANFGPVAGLPVTTYHAGEIDDNGYLYVVPFNSSNMLYRIDIVNRTATSVALDNNVDVWDLAYSITDNVLYAVNRASGSNRGKLTSIHPVTGEVNFIGATDSRRNFGAMYASSTGEIYGSYNNGGFYQFNLNTGVRTLISDSPSSNGNDGAHCVTEPITFDADLEITKTDGTTSYTPGTTTTYTIVVTNNGPFGVSGATVTDLVPTGIPAANVSYTAIASSGSTTTVSGTQTGAINDTVDIPVNGDVTYTVEVDIPLTFTGDLVNTATVTNPLNSSDPDMGNNTATDTNTRGTADLSLTKTVNNSNPDQGDDITFTITITNNGPSPANAIEVRDIIPTDFSYAHPNYTTSEGTVTFNNGTRALDWDLGTYLLPVGDSVALTYTVTVDVCGEFKNQAEIMASSLPDPDSTSGNGN